MTDKVKQLAPQIWAEIQKANRILLHCHSGPDGDSYGSVLAMVQVLESLGKNVTAIAGDDMKVPSFSTLPGFEKLVEKSFFDIELTDFDLFLILDSASSEQISKKEQVIFPALMKTVVIDHHPSNVGFGEINLIETSYPATSQLIFDLLNLWGLTITPGVALCLYVGMYTDTGGFKYAGTTPDTLFAAGALAKINPDFSKTLFTVENSSTPGELKYFSLALGSIEHYFSNNVAVASIRFPDLEKYHLKREDIRGSEMANFLKSVVGWNIAVALSEKSLDQVDISLRTRDPEKYDLSKLGTALGGGGLKAAGGATVKKPYEEAKQFVLDTILKLFPELGTP